MNLTYRSLASILKYDHEIETRSPKAKLKKGYYSTEADVIKRVRTAVLGDYQYDGALKVVECQIMDIADDIAYSTYDLEDAMKASFTSPLDFLSIDQEQELLTNVAITVWKRLNNREDDIDANNIPPELAKVIDDEKARVIETLYEITAEIVPEWDELEIDPEGSKAHKKGKLFLAVSRTHKTSKTVQNSGYFRTRLTSELVGEFIGAVTLEYNAACPALSTVRIEESARRKIEVLKNFTYQVHILAARLKTIEFRGAEIVKDIFKTLKRDPTHLLLPADWKYRCEAQKTDARSRLRTIADFVSGMTDRYALEFYQRLRSANPSTIFRDV